MKVILLKDVARIGKRFEELEVPTGHALNFLIPNKMAEPATKESLKRVRALKDKHAEANKAHDEAFQDALEALGDSTVTMEVEANEKGHLFKGIKAEDISAHLKTKNVALDARHIILDAPLKEVGDVVINLASGEQKGTFTLTLIAK
jgi:large subunit ribosomal protein L9